MAKSRFNNTIKNVFFGFGAGGIKLLFTFIVRTAFVYSLGVDYLGINGLFLNILSLLSLTDLGIYTVMVYALY